MEICLKNFSKESRNVIEKAKSLTKECTYGVVEPQVLFVALYSLEKDLCLELLNYMQISPNAFMIEISQSIKNIEHRNNGCICFSNGTELVLLKSMYLSCVNGDYSTNPEYIFQALMEESEAIKRIVSSMCNNENAITQAMDIFRQARPKKTFDDLEFDPDSVDFMQGWGFDVTNDENLTEFEKGYVIHALEEYCRSDYTREFSLGEKRLISKVDSHWHHIGPMARRFKEELNNER